LKVTLFTENRRGINRKTIYISSNAKDAEVKRIYITANITNRVNDKTGSP
jgi:hypothetical protein